MSLVVSRGIESQLGKLRHITAESVIEATIEDTLDTIDNVLKAMVIRVSGAWLQENQIAEKIHIEVNKVSSDGAVPCISPS